MWGVACVLVTYLWSPKVQNYKVPRVGQCEGIKRVLLCGGIQHFLYFSASGGVLWCAPLMLPFVQLTFYTERFRHIIHEIKKKKKGGTGADFEDLVDLFGCFLFFHVSYSTLNLLIVCNIVSNVIRSITVPCSRDEIWGCLEWKPVKPRPPKYYTCSNQGDWESRAPLAHHDLLQKRL